MHICTVGWTRTQDWLRLPIKDHGELFVPMALDWRKPTWFVKWQVIPLLSLTRHAVPISRKDTVTFIVLIAQEKKSYDVQYFLSFALVPVRLVGGDTPNEGRVEVGHVDYYYYYYWGTICSDSWDINDATVVCRMLGYPGVSSAMKSFGPGSGNIIFDNVSCDGSETHLTQCNHAGYLVHNCDHTEDVGVVCSGQAELGVRLVDGPDESQGRVELFYFGAWGTVCQYDWNLLDSHVVCKMLGFIGATGYSGYSTYGPGTGEILLREPGCTGKETNLLDCNLGYTFGETYCYDHTTDIGVSCLKWDDLQVRLVNGRSTKEGRVEVLYSGTWGTVCDDKWDLEDSDVVCRMLGFARAENFSCCAGFGPGSGPILLEDVECEGTESNIGHCRRSAYEIHNCDHSEDVGVSCIEYEVNQESSTSMAAETTETLSSGDMTNDGRNGISQAAAKGSIGFLSVLVIGILLVCIVMTVVMQKYRRIAMNRQSSNPNCYDGPQRGKDGTMELNTVSGSRIKDESSTNQADMYESLQHVDSRDLSYEHIQKRDK
nr:deleted in malignant brain tumors 1 protein-like [Lytechinus pictus]